jgi:hypothetical protein
LSIDSCGSGVGVDKKYLGAKPGTGSLLRTSMKSPWEGKWEVRECATLGTLFADVYRNGRLWARELDRRLAEYFVKQPDMFGRVYIDLPKMRTYMIESEGLLVTDALREKSAEG